METLSCFNMCSWIDDFDGTFEEEGCHYNQDALSASNGLALDLRAGTSEFNCSGVERWRGWVGRQRKGNAFQRGLYLVDLKTGCILCSLARGKAVWSWNVWRCWQQIRQESSIMKFRCSFSNKLLGMIGTCKTSSWQTHCG